MELMLSCQNLRYFHRIINDRIEKSKKGRRIGHTGERGRGLLCISTTVVMLAGLVLPWHTLRPPPFPMSGRAWGIGVVGGCARGCVGGGEWSQSPVC